MVLLGFSFDSLTKGDINDENSGSFRCSNSSGQWDSHDSNFLSLTTMKGRKMSQFFTAVYSCIFYNTVWPNRQGKSCPARHWTGAAHSTSCRSCSKGAETRHRFGDPVQENLGGARATSPSALCRLAGIFFAMEWCCVSKLKWHVACRMKWWFRGRSFKYFGICSYRYCAGPCLQQDAPWHSMSS